MFAKFLLEGFSQCFTKLTDKIKACFIDQKSIVAPSRLEANPNGKTLWLKNKVLITMWKSSPYYLTITKVRKNNTEVKDFEAVMIEPFGQRPLGAKKSDLGVTPAIEYLNDFVD